MGKKIGDVKGEALNWTLKNAPFTVWEQILEALMSAYIAGYRAARRTSRKRGKVG